MITPEQNTRYLNNPESCPHCGSDSIRAGEIEQTGDKSVFRPVTCNDCDKEWEENFSLSSITDQECTMLINDSLKNALKNVLNGAKFASDMMAHNCKEQKEMDNSISIVNDFLVEDKDQSPSVSSSESEIQKIYKPFNPLHRGPHMDPMEPV